MPERQPNILFIMSDDHAAHAMSCYGSRINQTPNLDRIAAQGVRLDNCLCTNSICTPSRATILTGLYSHKNDVLTLDDKLDHTRHTVVSTLLQQAGYQTAIVGKWHLGHGAPHDPVGFDYWNVLPGQGLYHNPVMIEMGERKTFPGYATDLITDFSLEWLRQRALTGHRIEAADMADLQVVSDPDEVARIVATGHARQRTYHRLDQPG